MIIKEAQPTETSYKIESDYGWLESKYFPDRAVEHFVNTFAKHVAGDNVNNPDYIDAPSRYSPYVAYASQLLERYAKQELEQALKNLVLKIEVQTLIAVEGKEPKEATKAIDKLVQNFAKETKVQLSAPKHGGVRRQRKNFVTDGELATFAKTVNSLRPLWEFITRYFQQYGHDLTGKDKIKTDKKFIDLSRFTTVPNSLLDKARRRTNMYLPGKNQNIALEPLGLALEHARLELSIGPYAVETLRKRYTEGKKILKQFTSLP